MTPAAFHLSAEDMRVVAGFVATAAEALLPFYEDGRPGDARPRDAVAAAWLFVGGAPRTALQRTASMDAHRAAASAADEVARLAAQAADRATPGLREILRRYPPPPAGRSRTAQLMETLDRALRTTP
ncbi:exonuclease SbcC [Mycolicibacterium sp. P9-22]|nr:exonuclease SbcC [Mycolicibacterium sp. P9-22]